MPDRYRHPEDLRRDLALKALAGCRVSAVMLALDVGYTEALDLLTERYGAPAYVKRMPATVIDLAEVRRLVAEAETETPNTDGEGDAA